MEFSSISSYEDFVEFSKKFVHDSFVMNGDTVLFSLLSLILSLLLYLIFSFVKQYIVTYCKYRLYPEQRHDEKLREFSKYKKSVIILTLLVSVIYYATKIIVENHKEDVFFYGKIISVIIYISFNIHYHFISKNAFDFFGDIKVIVQYLKQRDELNKKELEKLMTKKMN